ncbi:MAG: mannitol dehydrogenase family protein [Clostridia bacterium]|nr:mannitol dehydrogenase family protein [Clostridia bacterium]
MLHLNDAALSDRAAWEAAGISVPAYDRADMIRRTREQPIWLHFGAGNLFRAFPAAVADRLLCEGVLDRGVIAAEGFDFEIIDRIYAPHDNLSLCVTFLPDGSVGKRVIGSVAEAVKADESGLPRLTEIFCSPSLKMVSFTITEKGYSISRPDGSLLPGIEADMESGPDGAQTFLAKLTSLLLARFTAGGAPLALVSMDNCSHNGDKLRTAVLPIAQAWEERGLATSGFSAYLRDENRISFPISMIDKITPRPDGTVAEMLASTGFADTETVVTDKHTYIAPFVNAEKPQYLVIEDRFPAGRVPLDRGGILFTDRNTVDRVEKMKVCTCLNPLHTALAVFGCLLGKKRISEEMSDPQLAALVRTIGYREGLPVVTDPGILDPRRFLDEVVLERLPNPFMPDSPQRIATDTSQKMSVRFGETVKAYLKQGLDPSSLVGIPLVCAGWCRYLLGLDDEGNPLPLSPDPLLPALQSRLEGISLGSVGEEQAAAALSPILSNPAIFGVSLYDAGIGERVEFLFRRMSEGPGAVRRVLCEAFPSEK